MPAEIVFPTAVVATPVGPRAVLAEALFFPEYSRLAATPALAVAAVVGLLAAQIPRLPAGDLLRRRRAAAARKLAFTLEIPAPRAAAAWVRPVKLALAAAVWDHAGGFTLARVPLLAVEVVAGPKENLAELLARECLAAVRRGNFSKSLRTLSPLAAAGPTRVEWVQVPASVPSLKERAARDADTGTPKVNVLRSVATLMKAGDQPPAYELGAVIDELADALTADPPQSVLLVGPGGVGKTAAVRELVRTMRLPRPVYRTSGARMVAGQTGFGVWEERCQTLIADAAKARAVLHVGNLVELMDVGKSECNPGGVAAFLRPAIARGKLVCVAECTPEQIPLVEKDDPHLLDAFRQIFVPEPDGPAGRRILHAAAAAFRRRVPTPAAMAALDRLHRRYATYSAFPGRPLRFLDNLLRDGDPKSSVTEDEVYAGFAAETGLPRAVIDPAAPLDLKAARDWFAARVVGQPGPIDLVVDLLATIKAGLARPNRPLASLLFIGPTGVGKTETAKALAEFLFGSPDRLTRFDMSEYADPVAVRRLVGVGNSEGLLTGKVREQPFSVILLDEVEKADPSAFDLLLQALGEARLTDAGGRLADFRNAVVILTSNLGADAFRRGRSGFDAGAAAPAAGDHFTRAVEKFLRPEMFNRLDRVVPFDALPAAVVRTIAAREWEKVLARDGLRFRGVKVTAAAGLIDHLAAAGFDAKYGARPLKRGMERELLAPLARHLNRHAGNVPLAVEITATAGVSVRPIPGAKPAGRDPADPAGRLATRVQTLRRWHQALEGCSAVRDLANEIYQLTQTEARTLARQRRGKSAPADGAKTLARLGQLRELDGEITRRRQDAFDLEDAATAAFHDGLPPGELAARFAAADAAWDDLLMRVFRFTRPGATQLRLVLFGEHPANLAAMVSGIIGEATRNRLAFGVFGYRRPTTTEAAAALKRLLDTMPAASEPDAPYWHEDTLFAPRVPHPLLRREMIPPGDAERRARTDLFGLGFAITGAGAFARLGDEAGLHKFTATPGDPADADPNVLVLLADPVLTDWTPPPELLRKGAIKADRVRRVYDRPANTVVDPAAGRIWKDVYGDFSISLERVYADSLRRRLAKLVLE